MCIVAVERDGLIDRNCLQVLAGRSTLLLWQCLRSVLLLQFTCRRRLEGKEEGVVETSVHEVTPRMNVEARLYW